MGFAKPIEQYLFSNLLIRIHVFMYLKDIIRVEGWRSKVSEQKKKRRMKQFLFVVVTACILCGMCVVVLASNPVVSKQGVELAVNPTRAMIAMVFAMFCGILAVGYRHVEK